jgi:predicted transcriptional regulator
MEDQETNRISIEKLGLKNNELEAFKEIFKRPLSVAEVASILEQSYDTAYKKLEVWVARNFLKKISNKNKSRYYLNQDLIQV